MACRTEFVSMEGFLLPTSEYFHLKGRGFRINADVAHELSREILDRSENSASDHLAFQAAGDHLFEKADKLHTGMSLCDFALHLPRLHVQRCVEGQRAIPPIFKAMSLQPSGR